MVALSIKEYSGPHSVQITDRNDKKSRPDSKRILETDLTKEVNLDLKEIVATEADRLDEVDMPQTSARKQKNKRVKAKNRLKLNFGA